MQAQPASTHTVAPGGLEFNRDIKISDYSSTSVALPPWVYAHACAVSRYNNYVKHYYTYTLHRALLIAFFYLLFDFRKVWARG